MSDAENIPTKTYNEGKEEESSGDETAPPQDSPPQKVQVREVKVRGWIKSVNTTDEEGVVLDIYTSGDLLKCKLSAEQVKIFSDKFGPFLEQMCIYIKGRMTEDNIIHPTNIYLFETSSPDFPKVLTRTDASHLSIRTHSNLINAMLRSMTVASIYELCNRLGFNMTMMSPEVQGDDIGLCLEGLLPVLGPSCCMTSSSMGTNFHIEIPFIIFETLISVGADFISQLAQIIKTKASQRTITSHFDISVGDNFCEKMSYLEVIEYCEEKSLDIGVKYGSDITSEQSAKIASSKGHAIMICRFPSKLKSPHIERCQTETSFSNSFIVAVPDIGTITEGSSKIYSSQELISAYDKRNVELSSIRRDIATYGSPPHGGFKLNVDNLEKWLCSQKN